MAIKILIAEDDPTNQRLLQLLLAHLGAETKTVCDGQLALDLLKSERFDIALMDMDMPVLNGLEATKQLRAQPQKHAQPKIVAVTGTTISRETCLDAGADAFISKPIELRKLRILLDDLMIQSQSA